MGDKVRQADGTTGTVRMVKTEQKNQTMYNLDIAKLDNFYMGEQGWLVHNNNWSSSCSKIFVHMTSAYYNNVLKDIGGGHTRSALQDALKRGDITELGEPFVRNGITQHPYTARGGITGIKSVLPDDFDFAGLAKKVETTGQKWPNGIEFGYGGYKFLYNCPIGTGAPQIIPLKVDPYWRPQ